MDKNEIIERLGEIAKHAVYIIGEEPFIMSLDDGTAVYEAIDIIQQSQPQRIGHWKRCWVGTIAEGLFCDVCHKRGYGEDTCPNCGARMVTEEEI